MIRQRPTTAASMAFSLRDGCSGAAARSALTNLKSGCIGSRHSTCPLEMIRSCPSVRQGRRHARSDRLQSGRPQFSVTCRFEVKLGLRMCFIAGNLTQRAGGSIKRPVWFQRAHLQRPSRRKSLSHPALAQWGGSRFPAYRRQTGDGNCDHLPPRCSGAAQACRYLDRQAAGARSSLIRFLQRGSGRKSRSFILALALK